MTTATQLTDSCEIAADWYDENGNEDAVKFLRGNMTSEESCAFIDNGDKSAFQRAVNAATRSAYSDRQDRSVHPDGEFDNATRWYPSDAEDADNFSLSLRSPSRGYPYSYMVGARTRKHCRALVILCACGREVPADIETEVERNGVKRLLTRAIDAKRRDLIRSFKLLSS